MIKNFFPPFLYFFFLVHFSSAIFSIPSFLTEEDLLFALREGEICWEDYQNLKYLLTFKVDPNSEEIWELKIVPGVTYSDLWLIYQHRLANGPFQKIEEIKNVPYLKKEVFFKISPFIHIPAPSKLKLKGKTNISLSSAWEGENRTSLLKNKNYLFFGSHLKGYLVWEKNNYFQEDFQLKGSLQLRNLPGLKKVSWGDERKKIGEGLVFSQDFKGGLTEVQVGNFSSTFIYSSQTELGFKVFDLEFGAEDKNLGVSYLSAEDGKIVFGGHLKFLQPTQIIFSEWAKVKEEGSGLILGIELFQEKFHLLHSYRRYEVNFTNPFSQGLADSDGVDNDQDEEGLLWQLNYSLTPQTTLKTSFNLWQHPSDKSLSHQGEIDLSFPLLSQVNLKVRAKIEKNPSGQKSTFYGNLIYFPFEEGEIKIALKSEREKKLLTLKTTYLFEKIEIKLGGRRKITEEKVNLNWGELVEKYYLELNLPFSRGKIGLYLSKTLFHFKEDREKIRIWGEYEW